MSKKRSSGDRLKTFMRNLHIMGIAKEDLPEVKEALSNYTYGIMQSERRKGREEGVAEGFSKGLLYTGKIRE